MRKTFIDSLTEFARKDERIMCVIGDTGFSVFEEFESEFGNRFVNVGIAEQNFISIGAGLSAMGMKPYLYNVVSFMTLRGMEQIFLDICYQENPVVLVGVGGGFAYGTSGPTHHALQDIAMMAGIPNMTVVCPGDPIEMKAVMDFSYEYSKPMYIRIGRNTDPIVHIEGINLHFGKAINITKGDSGTIFVTGVMLNTAVEVVKRLNKIDIKLSLYSVPFIKPIDEETIIKEAKNGKKLFTLEEHSVVGGLGDIVGRVLMEKCKEMPISLYKFGVPDTFADITGNREYLDEYYGLNVDCIVEKICCLI